MTFEEDLYELESYGLELRNDWFDFDGRDALKKLTKIANQLRENCLDITKVREAIDRWAKYSSDRAMVKKSLLKELGL